jgi:hypothetical protein
MAAGIAPEQREYRAQIAERAHRFCDGVDA